MLATEQAAGWASQDPTCEGVDSQKEEDGRSSDRGDMKVRCGPQGRAKPILGISPSVIPGKMLLALPAAKG